MEQRNLNGESMRIGIGLLINNIFEWLLNELAALTCLSVSEWDTSVIQWVCVGKGRIGLGVRCWRIDSLIN